MNTTIEGDDCDNLQSGAPGYQPQLERCLPKLPHELSSFVDVIYELFYLDLEQLSAKEAKNEQTLWKSAGHKLFKVFLAAVIH